MRVCSGCFPVTVCVRVCVCVSWTCTPHSARLVLHTSEFEWVRICDVFKSWRLPLLCVLVCVHLSKPTRLFQYGCQCAPSIIRQCVFVCGRAAPDEVTDKGWPFGGPSLSPSYSPSINYSPSFSHTN